MATRASLALTPVTGGVELYERMIAFWTEASHALAHAVLPKTQVLERNVHSQRGTSIKRLCVLHKREKCYVVCKRATPTPKTNRNSNVGDYGRARTQTVRPVQNVVNSLQRHQQASQLANAPLHSILPQDFL